MHENEKEIEIESRRWNWKRKSDKKQRDEIGRRENDLHYIKLQILRENGGGTNENGGEGILLPTSKLQRRKRETPSNKNFKNYNKKRNEKNKDEFKFYLDFFKKPHTLSRGFLKPLVSLYFTKGYYNSSKKPMLKWYFYFSDWIKVIIHV